MRPFAVYPMSMTMAIVALELASCVRPPVEARERGMAGIERCATCHEQEARFCRYGAHRTLECETCHGPGAEHAEAEPGSRPGMSLGDAELCLSCHRQGATSPSRVVSTIESHEGHLRELEREHRIKLDRRKSGTDCVYCHDPHLLE